MEKKQNPKEAALGCAMLIAIAAGIWFWIDNKEDNSQGDDVKSAQATTVAENSKKDNDKWHQGGTLHDASAAEWCQATPESQLATAGDWISGLWINERLVPKIQDELTNKGEEGLKVMAMLLVADMEKTICEDNKVVPFFEKEKANTVAVISMMAAEWLKAEK